MDILHKKLKCGDYGPITTFNCPNGDISFDDKFINKCNHYVNEQVSPGETMLLDMTTQVYNSPHVSETEMSYNVRSKRANGGEAYNTPAKDYAREDIDSKGSSEEKKEQNSLGHVDSDNSNDGLSSGVSSETGFGEMQSNLGAISGGNFRSAASGASGPEEPSYSMSKGTDLTKTNRATEHSAVADRQDTSSHGTKNDRPANTPTESSSPKASSSRMTNPFLCCSVFVLMI